MTGGEGSTTIATLDRRRFILGAGVALGVGDACFAGARIPALVVGAGLSGLVCAGELEAYGFDVQLLEPNATAGEDGPALVACEPAPQVDADSPAGRWLDAHGFACDPARMVEALARRFASRIAAGFEVDRIERREDGVRVTDRAGRPRAAPLAIVALSRDSLRRVRLDPATAALAEDAAFGGEARRCVEIAFAARGRRDRVLVTGAEAGWLDSLHTEERVRHARRLAAARSGTAVDAIDSIDAESCNRRKWPLDLGRDDARDVHHGGAVAAPDAGGGRGPLAVAFCGSHRSPHAGLRGLIESGLAAARAVARA